MACAIASLSSSWSASIPILSIAFSPPSTFAAKRTPQRTFRKRCTIIPQFNKTMKKRRDISFIFAVQNTIMKPHNQISRLVSRNQEPLPQWYESLPKWLCGKLLFCSFGNAWAKPHQNRP